MQVVSSKKLIEKIDEYVKSNPSLLENEIVSFNLKKKIIEDEFGLSLNQIGKCSVIQKFYFRFILMQIKDSSNNLVGARIITDNNELYQVSLSTEMGISVNRYLVDDFDFKVSIGTINNSDCQEEVFCLNNCASSSSNSDFELIEMAKTRIFQAVEKTLGKDEMKIYQINRKKVVVPKVNYNLNNIIQFDSSRRS